ncbi:MAG: hypothetical protein GXX06_05550, partial [Gammaproteobacteria bacterium]|nr:hypothetical protein [Gammaproteobacteria bacterium]
RDLGAEVHVVMTRGAREFITPLTLQALSGNPVHVDLLDPNAEAAMPCDILIAAAAVADYRPELSAEHKLKKDPSIEEGLTLKLIRNPDILATLAQRADRPFSVGFAAETQNLLEYATRKLHDKNLDLIVANDVANSAIGFNSDDNAITVIDHQQQQTSFAQTSKSKIARQLIAFIASHINKV